MSSLRNVKVGTKVLIVHPPGNFEGFTQEGTVVGFDDTIVMIEFQADIVRHASFRIVNGQHVNTRLNTFIVLANPQGF